MPRIINFLHGQATAYTAILPSEYLGYTRDTDTTYWLRDEIRARSVLKSKTPFSEKSLDIQSFCEKYNESKTAAVYETVERHLDSIQKGLTTPGWSQAKYPPGTPPAPKDALSKLGEALVGWYLEKKGWALLHRPLEVCPDAIFDHNGAIALVEVKTTTKTPGPLHSSVESKLVTTATDVIDVWAKIKHIISTNPYEGYAGVVRLNGVSNINNSGSEMDATISLLGVGFT